RANQQHRSEQIRLEGREPLSVIAIIEASWQRAAVVVDQDVGRGTRLEQCGAPVLGVEVGGDWRDTDAALAPNLFRGCRELGCVPSVDDNVDPFRRQCTRAGAAQATTRSADDRLPPGYAEVHGFFSAWL